MELLKDKPFFGPLHHHGVGNHNNNINLNNSHPSASSAPTTGPGLSQLENSVQFCTSQLNLFSNELKLLLAQIEIISQFIHTKFGIELFNRESVLLHHSHDFCEIEEIAELIQTSGSFENYQKPVIVHNCGSDYSDGDPHKNTGSQQSNQSKKKRRRNKKPANSKIIGNNNPGNNSYRNSDLCSTNGTGNGCGDIKFNSNNRFSNSSMNSVADADPSKLHSCRFCGKMYNKQRYVTQHERTHTDDRPFPCQLCPKSFKLKQHLTCHIRTHTGERPYTCNICNKSFTQSKSLRIHSKQHEYSNKYVPPSNLVKTGAAGRNKQKIKAVKTSSAPSVINNSAATTDANGASKTVTVMESARSSLTTVPGTVSLKTESQSNSNPRQNQSQMEVLARENIHNQNQNPAPHLSQHHQHHHQQQQEQQQPLNYNSSTATATGTGPSGGNTDSPNSVPGPGPQQQQIHEENQNQNIGHHQQQQQQQQHPWNLNTVPLFPLSSSLSNLRGPPIALTSYGSSSVSVSGNYSNTGTGTGGTGTSGNNSNNSLALTLTNPQFSYHHQQQQHGNK